MEERDSPQGEARTWSAETLEESAGKMVRTRSARAADADRQEALTKRHWVSTAKRREPSLGVPQRCQGHQPPRSGRSRRLNRANVRRVASMWRSKRSAAWDDWSPRATPPTGRLLNRCRRRSSRLRINLSRTPEGSARVPSRRLRKIPRRGLGAAGLTPHPTSRRTRCSRALLRG